MADLDLGAAGSAGSGGGTGALHCDGGLIGASAGASGLAGRLSGSYRMYGSSGGVSGAVANLSSSLTQLVGVSSGVSVAGGGLECAWALVGVSQGATVPGGCRLHASLAFSGVASGVCVVALANLEERAVHMVGTSRGLTGGSSFLSEQLSLVGSAAGVAAAIGRSVVLRDLGGTSNGLGRPVAGLSFASLSMLVSSAGVGSTVGRLSAAVVLAGSAGGGSAVVVSIDRDRPWVQLSGVSSGGGGSVGHAVALAGRAVGLARCYEGSGGLFTGPRFEVRGGQLLQL